MKKAMFVVALAGAAVVASADTYTFDLSGLTSDGGFLDNWMITSLMHDFGSEGTVVGVEWDVAFEAFSPSWQSEAVISIDTTDDQSFDADIDPFFYGAPDAPGVFSYSDSMAAASYSSDGLVYLTLWEFFNDGIAPDAIYLSGSYVTVHFEAIPAPGSLALLGLGGLVARRRR